MIYKLSVAGIGGQTRFTRIRKGDEAVLTVELGAAPEEPPRDTRQTSASTAMPGITVSAINPGVIAERNLTLTSRGVLVDDPGRIGQRAGLQRGDILRLINGEEAQTTKDVEALLSQGGQWLTLDVQRGGKRTTMRFRL